MTHKRRFPRELVEQCFAVGHGYSEIARRFGVSVPAIYFYFNPDKRAEYFPNADAREMQRAYQREYRAARK